MLTEIRLEECELDCAMIGKRVRNARKAKKVTQEELSEHCGCTPTHICNLENGTGWCYVALSRARCSFETS